MRATQNQGTLLRVDLFLFAWPRKNFTRLQNTPSYLWIGNSVSNTWSRCSTFERKSNSKELRYLDGTVVIFTVQSKVYMTSRLKYTYVEHTNRVMRDCLQQQDVQYLQNSSTLIKPRRVGQLARLFSWIHLRLKLLGTNAGTYM